MTDWTTPRDIAPLVAAARRCEDLEAAYMAAKGDSAEDARLLAELEAAEQHFMDMHPQRLIATLSRTGPSPDEPTV